MQDNRKSQPKKLKKNERRSDMQIIRTRVSEKEIYVWTLSLVFMAIMLTMFTFVSLLMEVL